MLREADRPKVRIWALLALVAALAVAMGGWRAWQRRHDAFLRREYYRALLLRAEDQVLTLRTMASSERQMGRMGRAAAERGGTAPEQDGEPIYLQSERIAARSQAQADRISGLLPRLRELAARLEAGPDEGAEAEFQAMLERLP